MLRGLVLEQLAALKGAPKATPKGGAADPGARP
jgi:hypothetical protein